MLVRLPVENRISADAGEIGLLKRSMYGTRDAASKCERDWQEHIKSWGYQLGLGSKNLFRHEEHRVSGMTNGDDFMLTGQTDQLTEFRKIKDDDDMSLSGASYVTGLR